MTRDEIRDRSPAVTVVVPVWNRADLIAETLESVASQTFTDWECIVVDDGSTDATREVVRRFIDRDPRFRYVWQENSSAANARNHGLQMAASQFVAFLDSDDLFPPDKLAWQVEALQNNSQAVLVYGDTFQFRNGDLNCGSVYLDQIRDKPAGRAFEKLICCSSIYAPLVRTEAMRRLGGFDTTLPSAEDWDMWLSLSKIGTILYQPRIALRYRLHAGNKSANTLRNFACARLVVRKQLKDRPVWARVRLMKRVRRYFQRGYTDKLLAEAYESTKSRNWPAARELWRAAVRLNPRVLTRRSIFFHALWACLPVQSAPIWHRFRRPGVARAVALSVFSPWAGRRDG